MKRVKLRRVFAFEGAECVVLVYTDGTARVRVDHPSNDPAREGLIGGMLAERMGEWFRDAGFDGVNVGPISWRSDADGTPARWHRR